MRCREKEHFVYPCLGKSGLGNLLFPWARAEVFALKHGMKVIGPRWARIDRVGVWLRLERYKRYYGSCFTNTGFVCGLKRLLLLMRGSRIDENSWDSNSDVDIVEFQGMEGGFSPLLSHQNFIKRRLYEIVSPAIVSASIHLKPYIAVHIRRGDFCFSHLKTSDDWFIKATEHSLCLPVSRDVSDIRIFSDAYPKDLNDIVEYFKRVGGYNIIVMPKAPAIQDILSLSRAVVLVASPHSTFSAWGVFLGQMPSVWGTRFEVPTMYIGEDKTILVEG